MCRADAVVAAEERDACRARLAKRRHADRRRRGRQQRDVKTRDACEQRAAPRIGERAEAEPVAYDDASVHPVRLDAVEQQIEGERAEFAGLVKMNVDGPTVLRRERECDIERRGRIAVDGGRIERAQHVGAVCPTRHGAVRACPGASWRQTAETRRSARTSASAARVAHTPSRWRRPASVSISTCVRRRVVPRRRNSSASARDACPASWPFLARQRRSFSRCGRRAAAPVRCDTTAWPTWSCPDACGLRRSWAAATRPRHR